jgi:hypothetical protein
MATTKEARKGKGDTLVCAQKLDDGRPWNGAPVENSFSSIQIQRVVDSRRQQQQQQHGYIAQTTYQTPDQSIDQAKKMRWMGGESKRWESGSGLRGVSQNWQTGSLRIGTHRSSADGSPNNRYDGTMKYGLVETVLLLLASIALFVPSGHAFVGVSMAFSTSGRDNHHSSKTPPKPHRRPSFCSSTGAASRLSSAAQKLSDMDVMCLENVAELCAQVEESCDVEDHEAIMNQLDAQLTEFHNDHIHLESFERLKELIQHRHEQEPGVVTEQ